MRFRISKRELKDVLWSLPTFPAVVWISKRELKASANIILSTSTLTTGISKRELKAYSSSHRLVHRPFQRISKRELKAFTSCGRGHQNTASESQKENWKRVLNSPYFLCFGGWESQKENWKSTGGTRSGFPSRGRISKREFKAKRSPPTPLPELFVNTGTYMLS